MERSFSWHISRALVAERSQIEASEQRLAGTKQHRPDGQVHFVDEAGAQVLSNRGGPAAEADVTVTSGRFRSLEGGMDPVWSHDGTELFYRNGDKMMAVSVSLAGEFRPGKPVLLWEGHYSLGMSSSCGPPGVSSGNYDVTSDGRRFLMVKDLDQDAGSTRIVVVVNFAEELKRVVKTN